MTEFCLPILGFGDENHPSYTVVWKDGTVLCRGILGDFPHNETVALEPEQPDNIVSFNEFKEKRNAIKERSL
jgi:hypothetical protein